MPFRASMPTSPPSPRQRVRKSDSNSGFGMCGMTVLCSCTSTFFSRSEGRGSLSSPSQASLHEGKDGGEMASLRECDHRWKVEQD